MDLVGLRLVHVSAGREVGVEQLFEGYLCHRGVRGSRMWLYGRRGLRFLRLWGPWRLLQRHMIVGRATGRRLLAEECR